eukprot:394654-Hanusia_phi.AAC.1
MVEAAGSGSHPGYAGPDDRAGRRPAEKMEEDEAVIGSGDTAWLAWYMEATDRDPVVREYSTRR